MASQEVNMHMVIEIQGAFFACPISSVHNLATHLQVQTVLHMHPPIIGFTYYMGHMRCVLDPKHILFHSEPPNKDKCEPHNKDKYEPSHNKDTTDCVSSTKPDIQTNYKTCMLLLKNEEGIICCMPIEAYYMLELDELIACQHFDIYAGHCYTSIHGKKRCINIINMRYFWKKALLSKA